eukprot:GEMP01051695.1.p1 GENE.GEMP01051695.1~~GEMP01051695.1.p1  ORF type:complete len:114 (-),score=2.55 GEMP01051695.1:244-585(-)
MSLYIYKYTHVNDFFFIAVRRNISKDHVLRVPSSHPAFLLILRFRLSDVPQKVGLETKKYQPHGKKETNVLREQALQCPPFTPFDNIVLDRRGNSVKKYSTHIYYCTLIICIE